MQNESPYFSFVIPTYNRGSTIRSTIDSILKQQFADIEIIVVDDGSSDNTELVVHDLRDPRIRYFKIENSERGAARNYGAKLAIGRYINFFDSDDVLLPCLSDLFLFLEKNLSPRVVYGSIQVITAKGVIHAKQRLPYMTFTRNILFNNFLACGSVFLKQDVALEYPFEEDRRLSSAEDWELWLRISSRYEFLKFPKPVFQLTEHDDRSLNTIKPELVIERELLLYQLIERNQMVRSRYGNALNKFLADRYTFVSLMNALLLKKNDAIIYQLKAIRTSVSVIFRKRFWAVVKKLIFS
jgi:glycosyltransferase involved in cell wall biosynthesis